MAADVTAGVETRSFRLMLAATVLGFGGYALLLPVVPLWAARGGSGAFGAGTTTGVLMLVTVATQLTVPWLLGRAGHRRVMMLGLMLLGAPAPLLALSAELGPVLAVSAVRGVGFGLVTVTGSALVAELVPADRHGRAAGRYGLAVGLPQLVLLSAGVAATQQAGFAVVFAAAGAFPMVGALVAVAVRVPSRTGPAPAGEPLFCASAGVSTSAPSGRAGPVAWRPVVAMLACSTAQGGLITFLPLSVPGGGPVVALALLGTAAGALAGRLAAGELVDRRGWGGRLLRPGVLVAGAGMTVEVVVGSGALVVAGAVLVGLGFGLVQNDALTVLFEAAGPLRYGPASAAWNIGYDAGTGAGAVGLGAVADPFGYAAAFGTSAVLLGVVALGSRRPRST